MEQGLAVLGAFCMLGLCGVLGFHLGYTEAEVGFLEYPNHFKSVARSSHPNVQLQELPMP